MASNVSAGRGPASGLPDIAIVDDDESVRRSLGQLLRAAGFNAIAFSSAEEFLEYATSSRIQCLVLDINLDGMSGFDLQRHLSATGDAPPIIFITGYERPDTEQMARQAHCAGYFTKPLPGHALLDSIRAAVETDASSE